MTLLVLYSFYFLCLKWNQNIGPSMQYFALVILIQASLPIRQRCCLPISAIGHPLTGGTKSPTENLLHPNNMHS